MTVLRITGESPFSLIKTRFFGSERVAGASADDEEGAGAAYVKNLTRLIPGEALSLYAAGKSPPICRIGVYGQFTVWLRRFSSVGRPQEIKVPGNHSFGRLGFPSVPSSCGYIRKGIGFFGIRFPRTGCMW